MSKLIIILFVAVSYSAFSSAMEVKKREYPQSTEQISKKLHSADVTQALTYICIASNHSNKACFTEHADLGELKRHLREKHGMPLKNIERYSFVKGHSLSMNK